MQPAGSGQPNANDIVKEGPDQIPANTAVGGLGQLPDPDHLGQIFAQQADVGRFAGNVHPAAQRNADIRRSQRRPVVQPVADHCNPLPLLL